MVIRLCFHWSQLKEKKYRYLESLLMRTREI